MNNQTMKIEQSNFFDHLEMEKWRNGKMMMDQWWFQ